MAVDFFNKLLLVIILISSPVEVTNPNIFQRFSPRKEYSPELNHFLDLLRDSKEDLRWIEKTARDVLHANQRRQIQSEDGYMYPSQNKENLYRDRRSRTNNKYIKRLNSVPARPENDAFPYMYAKQYYRRKRLFDRRRKRNLPRRIESIYQRKNEWGDKPNINFNKFYKSQIRRDTDYIDREKPRGIHVDIFPRSQEGVLRKYDLPDNKHVTNDQLIRVSKSCYCKSLKNGHKCSNCKNKAHTPCKTGCKRTEDQNADEILYEDLLAESDGDDIDLDDESIENSLDDIEMNADRGSRNDKHIFKWFERKGQSNEESSNENEIQMKNSKRGKGSAACDFEKCKGDSVKCAGNSGETVEDSKSESSDSTTSKDNATAEKLKQKDKKMGNKHQCGNDSNKNKIESQQNKRDTGQSESKNKKQRKTKTFPGTDFIKKIKTKSNEKFKTSDKTDDEDMNDNSTSIGIQKLVTKTPYIERRCTGNGLEGCQQETSTEDALNNKDSTTKDSHKNCKQLKQSSILSIKDKLKSKIFPNKTKSSNCKGNTRHFAEEDLNSYKDLNKLASNILDVANNRPSKDINSLSVQDTRNLLSTNAVKKKVDELMQILDESKATRKFSIEHGIENQINSPTKAVEKREPNKDHVDREASTLFPDNDNVIGTVVTKVLSQDTSSTSSDNHVNTLDELREPTSAAEQRNLLIENPVLSTPQQSTTRDSSDTTTDNVIQVVKLKRNPLTKADQFFGSQKEGAPHVKKILKDDNEPAINTNQDKADSNIYKEDTSIAASSSRNTKLERNNRFDPQEPFMGNDYPDNLENYYDYDADYDPRVQKNKRNYNKFTSFKSRKLHAVQPSALTMQKPEVSKNSRRSDSEISSDFPDSDELIEFYYDPDWDVPLNKDRKSIKKRSEDDEYEEADPVIGEKVKYNLLKNSQVRFDNKFNNPQSAEEYYAKKSNKKIIDSTNGNSLHKMKQREDENDNEEIIPIKENFEFFPREQQEISIVSSKPTPSSSNPSNDNIMTLKGNLKISPNLQDKQFLVNIQPSSTLSTPNAIQRDVINPTLTLPQITIHPHMLLLATKISLNSNDKSLRKVDGFPEQSESTTNIMFTTPQSDLNLKINSRHTTKKSTKFTNLLKNKFKQRRDPVLDIIRTNEIGLSDSLKREKKSANNDNDKQRFKHAVTSIEIVAVPDDVSPSGTTPVSKSTITTPRIYIKANENDDYSTDYANLDRNLRSIHFFNSPKKPTDHKKNCVKQKSRNSKHSILGKIKLQKEDNEKVKYDEQSAYKEDLPLSTIKEYNQDIPTAEKYNKMQMPIERNAFFNFSPLQLDPFLHNDDSNSYNLFDKPSPIYHENRITKPPGEGFPLNEIVNPKQHTPTKINDFNPFDAVFKNGKFQLSPAGIEPEVKYGNDIGPYKKGTFDINNDKQQNSNPQVIYDGEQMWKNLEDIPQYELRSLNDPQNYNQQIQLPPLLQDHFPLDLLDNIREISIKSVPSSNSESETESSYQVNNNFPSNTPILYFPFPLSDDLSSKKQEIKTVKTSHKGGGGIHPVEKNFKSKYYYETITTNVEMDDLNPAVNKNKEVALTSQTIGDSNLNHNSQVRDNSLEFSTMSNEELLKNVQKRLQGSTLSICLSLSPFDGTTPTSSGVAIKRFESQIAQTPIEQPKLEGNVIQAKELEIDLPKDHLFDKTSGTSTPKPIIDSESTSEAFPFATPQSTTSTKKEALNLKADYFDDYDSYDEMFEEAEKLSPNKHRLKKNSIKRNRRSTFTNSKRALPIQREYYKRIRKRSRPKRQLRMIPIPFSKRVRRATNMLPNYLKNIQEYKNGQNFHDHSHFYYGSRRDRITETPYDPQLLQLGKSIRRRDSDNDEGSSDKLALAIRESIADLSNKQWSHLLGKNWNERALGNQVNRDAGVSVEVRIDDSILKLFQQFKEIMLKEIERESCQQLTPDQRSYLQTITSASQTHDLHFKRESLSKSARETEPVYFMFKGNKRRRLFYDDDNRALQNAELSKEIDYEKTKRDIKIKYKKIKRLLNEYERLDEDSKAKVEPVEKYLKRNIRILRNLYKNVLMDENKPELVNSRKRQYMYDSNHITVNPYSTMPYGIIKKETHRIKSPSKKERQRHNKIAKIKAAKKREPLPSPSANNHKVEKLDSVNDRRYIQQESINDMKRDKRNLETDSTSSTSNSFEKTVSDAVRSLFDKTFNKKHIETTTIVSSTTTSVTTSPDDIKTTTSAASSPSPTQNTAVHARTVSDEYKQLVEAVKESQIKRQSDERLGMLFGNALEVDSRSTEENFNAGFEVPVIYS